MSQADANGGRERELPSAINGTEERLDVMIDQLDDMLADIRTYLARVQPQSVVNADPSIVKLREPGTSAKRR